ITNRDSVISRQQGKRLEVIRGVAENNFPIIGQKGPSAGAINSVEYTAHKGLERHRWSRGFVRSQVILQSQAIHAAVLRQMDSRELFVLAAFSGASVFQHTE
ncbi:MAG: hypothetical protein SNJ62_04140, partial [Chloracidobacterium sp.]